MSNPFVAEIRIFGGNFAPKAWALCNGQLLALSQNTALFSLLGTYYGGDGKTNFALPNLQGSAPMQQGQGPGLSLRTLGENGGEQTVTLLQSEIPAHNHSALASSTGGNANPGNNAWGGALKGHGGIYAASNASTNVPMNPLGTSPSGGSQPHNNLHPFLGLTFIIALQGVFPPRG